MKLNKKDKSKLIFDITFELYDYDGDKRVHIDKELLEDLLFEKDIVVLPDGRKLEVKFIVWSGSVLSKIDLSEVSFDNVEWDVSSKYYKIINEIGAGVTEIYLANTNAKIDFNKSFSRLAYPNSKIKITRCNFYNVDLSNANGEVIDNISNCDLVNTNIKLDLNMNNKMVIWRSNLSGIDLSNMALPVSVFVSKESSNFYIIETDLCDTGIHIEYRDYSKLPNGMLSKYINKKRSRETFDEEETKEYEKYEDILYQGFKLSEIIKSGFLNGCYINGKYKPNTEERNLQKASLLEQYEDMKQKLTNTTMESLSSQIRTLKK